MKLIFSKNDYLWGLFWIIVLVAVFFIPVIVRRQSLHEMQSPYLASYDFHKLKTSWQLDGGHTRNQSVPGIIAASRMVRQGILPLWTPYVGAGEPLAANMISAAYQPLRLIFFTLFNGIKAFDYFILLELILAGFGVFIYLKELALDKRAALFGAVAFIFSGFFMIFLNSYVLILYVFTPYVLFAFERYFKKQSWGTIALAGFLFSLVILGSHPVITLLLVFFLTGYFIYRVFLDDSLRKRYFFHLKFFCAIGAIAILISLPLIADFLTLLSQGHIFYRIEHRTSFFRMPPIYLLHFLVPTTMNFELSRTGGLYQYSEFAIPYIGFAVLILVILYIFSGNKNKISYFFYGVIILALLKIFGIPPVYWLAHVPVIKEINGLKLLELTTLCFGILGAFGYDALIRKPINWRGFWYTIASILVLFFVVALIFPQAFWGSYLMNFSSFQDKLVYLNSLPSWFSNSFVFLLVNPKFFTLILFGWSILIVSLICFLLWRYQKVRSSFVYFLIFVLLIIELWIYMPKLRDGFFTEVNPYEPILPFVELLQAQSKTEIFRIVGSSPILTPQIGNYIEVQDFRSESPVFLKRYWAFIGGDERAYFYSNNLLAEKLNNIPTFLMDLANVKYVLSEDYLSNWSRSDIVYDNEIKIYENRNVLDRAYIVFSAQEVNNINEAVSAIFNPNFDYRNSVVLEDNNEINFGNSVIHSNLAIKEAMVEIVNYKPNRVEISVNTEQDGILVLSDSFYPGWRAFIDGKETKIHPANVLFRGILVPAGNHNIVFVYRSLWIYIAFFISILTVLGIVLIWIKAISHKSSAISY